MTVWRQAHADAPSSKKLNRLSDQGERLFWRMLGQTDQWGRLTGDPHKIRLLCIPALPWDDDTLHRAINELEKVGSIDRYSTDGVWVIQIRNFDRRQPFLTQRRKQSHYPDRTSASLSPGDLAPPLPLPDQRPEACAPALPLPPVGLEACGPSLSHGDLRPDGAQKTPATTGETREKREDRKERFLPTAEVVKPARGLSAAQTIQDSLDQAALSTRFVLPEGLPSVPTSDLTQAMMAVGVSDGGFGRLPASSHEFPPEDLRSVVARIRDADDGTLNVLAKLRRELPVSAFLAAVESLEERRLRPPPLRGEARYVVGALKTMLREGHYGGAVA